MVDNEVQKAYRKAREEFKLEHPNLVEKEGLETISLWFFIRGAIQGLDEAMKTRRG